MWTRPLPFSASRRAAWAAPLALSLLVPVALAASAPPAHAQRAARVRPAFEPKLEKKARVSGTVRFRIVARSQGLPHEFAPIGYGGWAAVVRVDGHVLASLKKLPATVEWNTREAGDGVHSVSVAVRNAGADLEVGVEGEQVIVDNAAADTAAEAAELARAAEGKSSAEAEPVLQVPEVARVSAVPARLSASADPLSARATALLKSGPRLYLGLPDGGIAFCTPGVDARPRGAVVRLPAWGGAVRSLAIGGGRVWWVTEDGRAVYAYHDATRAVSRFDVTGALVTPPPPAPAPDTPSAMPEAGATPPTPETLETSPTPAQPPAETPPATAPETPPVIPVSPPKPTGWVRGVAVLRGQVLLLGDAGTVRALDPATGKLTAAPDGLLPAEAVTPTEGDAGAPVRVYVAAAGSDGRGAAQVVALSHTPAPVASEAAATLAASRQEPGAASPRWRRYRLRAWRSGPDGAWKQVASFTTDAGPERVARLAVAPDFLATAEREGPRLVSSGAADPRDLPYDLSPGMPSSTDRVAVAASGLWWEQRGIVFRADPSTGARDAYLPWNVGGDTGAVLALAADGDGVWVATTAAGVRRIRPSRPSARDGYNGYVRARLGAATLRPRDGRIAWAIEAWQGVPYVWGGQSRWGTDCSGFVMKMHQVCGVSIPRTTAEMRRTPRGGRVRDELRWGDTLVFPGHCAIYVGDGRTAETVGGTRGGSVSHSSIWVRSNVVVRRFLP